MHGYRGQDFGVWGLGVTVYRQDLDFEDYCVWLMEGVKARLRFTLRRQWHTWDIAAVPTSLRPIQEQLQQPFSWRINENRRKISLAKRLRGFYVRGSGAFRIRCVNPRFKVSFTSTPSS